jgi:dTDP-4-amino-4,6-dideoxygalactose transaminase
MINVTKTYLPDLEHYNSYLKKIWESGHLTNNGPFVQELEKKLKDYFGCKHFFFVNNGTIAIQIAIKVLNLKDEVITTPFSYVATTSSIAWENCSPIFADIDPKTLCINPDEIEAKITNKTTAIVATHVYGIPCNVEKIETLAQKYNLKVIYDAAHAFGVKYKNKALVNYGDISTLSFHATKLFHTIEGGAIITNNDELAHKISYMRNFGHNGQEAFWGIGINGKHSEFNAAMGLCVFPDIDKIINARLNHSETYSKLLNKDIISRPELPRDTDYNYAYYPVLFKSEEDLLKAKIALNKLDIFPRRYFYPSLNKLNYVGNQPMLVTEDISPRVLCLPLYFDLSYEDIIKICNAINELTV